MKYYLTPVRMAIMQRKESNKIRKDVEKRKLLHIVGENIKLQVTEENSVEVLQTKQQTTDLHRIQ